MDSGPDGELECQAYNSRSTTLRECWARQFPETRRVSTRSWRSSRGTWNRLRETLSRSRSRTATVPTSGRLRELPARCDISWELVEVDRSLLLASRASSFHRPACGAYSSFHFDRDNQGSLVLGGGVEGL